MNLVSHLSSANSCLGFCPPNNAPDAPAPALDRLFAENSMGGLQSLLQDVFGSQSAEIIEELYAFQQKLHTMPAADGQRPDFTFLNALEFFGEAGDRRVQLSETASPAIKADYQKMVNHLQEILNAPELLPFTKAIASKNEAQHLRNKGILSCLVVGVIVAACFLGGCFVLPLPLYITLGAAALGAAGMQLWYKAQERSCANIEQAEFGKMLSKMNTEVAALAQVYPGILSDLAKDQEYFAALKTEDCVFEFKHYALWKSLLYHSLLDQVRRAVQANNDSLLESLLKPFGYLHADTEATTSQQITKSFWFEAVKQGDMALCQALLAYSVQPAVKDNFGFTALHHAISANNWALFVVLVRHLNRERSKIGAHWFKDADKDSRFKANLLEHATKSQQKCLKKIFDGQLGTPLYYAMWMGDRETVTRLLEASDTKINALDSDGNTALHEAIDLGDKDLCALLLQHKANVNATNKYGNSALHQAAMRGNQAICALLLQHKADVNAANKVGDTALHKAAHEGHEAVCALLLQHKANVNATNKLGSTALHPAVGSGHEAVCTLLLQHKANVNAVNKIGNTALHINIELTFSKSKPIFLRLLRHGADVNIRTKDGQSPLTLAFQQHMDFPQNKDLFLFLLHAGGDVNHIFELNEKGGLKPKWDPVALKNYIKNLAKPFVKRLTNLLEKATASRDPLDPRRLPSAVIDNIIAPFII